MKNIRNKILINNNLEKYKLELYNISGMQNYINIQKAININHHTSKKKKKYHHMIFVMKTECYKIQHPFR